ncbi:MAG: hypothetical protein CMI18_07945 [Opitutaceae bacterium]|nr:hypothetical protein [Opitutaceae bacterium]
MGRKRAGACLVISIIGLFIRCYDSTTFIPLIYDQQLTKFLVGFKNRATIGNSNHLNASYP